MDHMNCNSEPLCSTLESQSTQTFHSSSHWVSPHRQALWSRQFLLPIDAWSGKSHVYSEPSLPIPPRLAPRTASARVACTSGTLGSTQCKWRGYSWHLVTSGTFQRSAPSRNTSEISRQSWFPSKTTNQQTNRFKKSKFAQQEASFGGVCTRETHAEALLSPVVPTGQCIKVFTTALPLGLPLRLPPGLPRPELV